MPDWAARFRAGERHALSRVLSLAERGDAAFPALFDTLVADTGAARRIGITGPPGAGKSSLVAALLGEWRGADRRVGVVAVDPTSPFTGGALLGDRVRMGAHTLDPGVFIRSMATRGSLGGLARLSVEFADLMSAFGFDLVVTETVGVGQIEHDVIDSSELVVVLLHPGAGDSVQALKAGLLELADIFVLNKADQPGIERLEADVREMLELRSLRHGEAIPIVRTVAPKGEGVTTLAATLDACAERLGASGELARRAERRRCAQLRRLVTERLEERLFVGDQARTFLDQLDDEAARRPYACAEALLATLLGSVGTTGTQAKGI